MDFTIKNISQLQDGLERMRKQSNSPTPNTPDDNNPAIPDNTDTYYPMHTPDDTTDSQYSTPTGSYKPRTSASRMNSSQMSTSGLLTNMAALQTNTNTKIDKMADALYGLYHSLDKINKQQIKQTELLNTIARNTANMKLTIEESSNSGNNGKSVKGKSGSIKDYGFTTAKHLFAEFLMKMLLQIQKEAIGRSKGYTSTRDLNLAVAKRLITVAMDNEFKIDGEVRGKIDANSTSHPSLVKIASQIGDENGANSILTPESFREIIENVDSKFFVSCFRQILERLSIIKVLIPFYESDIISAIEYPYFNKNGEAICDWSKVIPRSETTVETRVSAASVSERNKLAQYLAKGVSQKAAINAALGSL